MDDEKVALKTALWKLLKQENSISDSRPTKM